LADCIRLFAPNAPFNDNELEKIFQLFIYQLKELESSDAATFERTFYLLEKLKIVKAFVLMIDLNDDEQLIALFNLFFSIASEEPSKKKVTTLMIEILSSLIEDCRTIPQALLESILQNLIPAKKKENISAYNLAVSLLNKCPNLIAPFAQFFSDTNSESKHSELKEYAHDLILELNQISPKLVETVLPQIEEELLSTEQKLRKGAIDILGNLFSKKYFNCYT